MPRPLPFDLDQIALGESDERQPAYRVLVFDVRSTSDTIQDIVVENILNSTTGPLEITDFVTVLSTEVDPITQRELVMGGFVGMVLNCTIITSAGQNTFEVVPSGDIYCVTAPEFLGGFPIWVELFSEPVNQFMQGKPVRGWFWYEHRN